MHVYSYVLAHWHMEWSCNKWKTNGNNVALLLTLRFVSRRQCKVIVSDVAGLVSLAEKINTSSTKTSAKIVHLAGGPTITSQVRLALMRAGIVALTIAAGLFIRQINSVKEITIKRIARQ